jgi:hypothetical protein
MGKNKPDMPTKSVSLRNDKRSRLEFVRHSPTASANLEADRFRPTVIFAGPNPFATWRFQNRACA